MTHPAHETVAAQAAVPVLTPVLSQRWALGGRHVTICAWFSLFFLYLNYMPLFYSDIWCHVHYGQWMLEHGELVKDDPFMPLAEGMKAANNAWLSQVLLAQLHAWGGPHFVSHAFALTGLAAYLLYFRTFYLFSKNVWLAQGGVLLVLTLGWTRHQIVRPEMFGVLFLAFLFWMVVRLEPWRSRARAFFGGDDADDAKSAEAADRCPRWIWLATPVLFVIWANAHGSFAVGLVFLACHAAGRALEVLFATRSPLAVFRDRSVRVWTLLTELALLATLVNPYGVDLLIETATFGRNPNLRDVLEWFPLKLIDLEGLAFLFSIVCLVTLARHSRQAFRAADVLLILFFAAASAPTVRMIGWYAPVLTFAVMPHVSEIGARWLAGRRRRAAAAAATADAARTATADANSAGPAPVRERSSFEFLGTLACGLLIWTSFALSPLGQTFLGGKLRRADQIYSKNTPLGVSAHLREHRPQSLTFSPQWWGDWLAWDAKVPQLMVTTHVHLVPSQVWKDYLRIARGQTGWDYALDRYTIRTLVADKHLQPELVRQVRRSGQWKVVYEDKLGIVAERVNPAA